MREPGNAQRRDVQEEIKKRIGDYDHCFDDGLPRTKATDTMKDALLNC